MNVEEIEGPEFLKQLNIEELEELSRDIRSFLIKNVSSHGGHFSSNLGVVELTVAMHYVFNSPKDKMIFDVGHQSYVHKILTGRASEFSNMRSFGGVSGFQKRCESEHDCWEAGHSSTALSGGIGIATARDLNHEDYEVICVIGDAALMSGESLEALNFLGSRHSKVIVILNDNNMSITKNVGGFSNFLSDIRISTQYKNAKTNYTRILTQSKTGEKVYNATKRVKDALKNKVLAGSMFSQLGLDYMGPVDGHDIEELIRALEAVKSADHSVVLHVQTIKGKGYAPAEHDKFGYYHGVKPFDLEKGIIHTLNADQHSWSASIADHMEYLMAKHEDICVITPAMIAGCALKNIFQKYPERSFDVGIAEEHAMTFTAGLAIAHKFPFLSIYSSFSQRAYDQLNHDIARMNLHCLIGIDRAGLVGEDGPTHHGVFDIGYMMPIPHLILMAPHDEEEAQKMINTAYFHKNAPYVMRYSKSMIKNTKTHTNETIEIGTWVKEFFDVNNETSIVTYGDNVLKVKQMIIEKHLPVNLINARFLKPMDYQMLEEISHHKIIVYETDMLNGSLGEAMSFYYSQKQLNVKMQCMGIGDHYVTHGNVDKLLCVERLSIDDLLAKIEESGNEKRTN